MTVTTTPESPPMRVVPRTATLTRLLVQPPSPCIARELSRIAADRLGRKLAALETADRCDLRRLP
jgi:hypothetical protein